MPADALRGGARPVPRRRLGTLEPPERHRCRRIIPLLRRLVLASTAVAAAVILAAFATAHPADSVPAALSGVPLADTGLALLVASNPPFVIDIDTGRVTHVRGLDVRGEPVLTVLDVGRNAVVWLQRRATGRSVPRAEIYVVPDGTTRATRIATASEVAPSIDGAGVWLKSYLSRDRCSLREIDLGGSLRTRPWSVSCSSRLVNAGGRALLISGTRLVEPASRWMLARAPLALGLSRDVLVTATGPQGSVVLTDLRTGSATRLAYPSRIRGQGGFDEAIVDPTGRFVALSFADPAYELSATQVTDVWLLDTERGTLRQLPDMPAAVSLKRTSMAWVHDGRLVILAESAGRTLVAAWRPDAERLSVRPIRLPMRASGSDAFVAR